MTGRAERNDPDFHHRGTEAQRGLADVKGLVAFGSSLVVSSRQYF